MTTCRDLIRSAMLEIRAIASGEQPTANEESDCLFRLQGIVDGLFGSGVGTSLADVVVTTDSDLLPDTRNLIFADAALTLNMPEMPVNGERVQIKDMLGNLATFPVTISATPTDILLNTNEGDYTFVYIGSAGSWMLVSPLTADSTIPLGDDEFFTLELAKRVAPMFGSALSAESAAALLKAGNRIRARFRSQAVIPCDDAVRFLSRQSYNTGLQNPDA